MTNCIEIEGLNFSYNGDTVLEDITFSVKSGEYLGIIGPNGSGKTTLIKIILRILRADSGKIRLFGEDINDFSDLYRIGYVPQKVSQSEFYFPATVYEVIKSGLCAKKGLFKRLVEKDRLSMEKAMEIAEVTEFRNTLISRLSGGQRQRVFIARALAVEPGILMLDEPATGIDIASQDKFYSFLNELNTRLGITIVFVTHDLGVIADEANSILCINKKVCCYGPPDQYIKEEFLEEVYGRKLSIHKHKIRHEH